MILLTPSVTNADLIAGGLAASPGKPDSLEVRGNVRRKRCMSHEAVGQGAGASFFAEAAGAR